MEGPSPPTADGSLEVRRLVLGAFQSNTYLLRRVARETALVIDPGAEPGRIESALDGWGTPPEAILLTHAHLDHVGAVADLVERYDAPVFLHPADRPLYDGASDQAAAFGLSIRPPPPPDRSLAHGELLELAGLRLEIRHAPGHSPGGVVLVTDGYAFVGDCVFAGSIGRTDLPGGDPAALLRSIREHILTLPGDTILCSGHGPETTVSAEAATNPFLTGLLGRGG
ncbi:MAG: MBL fold metallo-hydrolase [Gemmatimonadota bacterium]